jgi:DNA-binding response OmpR family regulator
MTNTETPILILSLSACAGDHETLAGILQPDGWTTHWASTLPGSTQLLRSHRFSVIVSDHDLPPHSWKDLLTEVAALPKPPLIIVTSPYADDYLWAEALNLGAYDVLPKPFDAAEVRRTLSIAVLHWQMEYGTGFAVAGEGGGRIEGAQG